MAALSHLRVVEIGSAAATSYCARLFADFGAAVAKVEPPDGDPLRTTAPLTPKGQSAWFAFLNFNKSSVALDPDDAGDVARLAELIGGCDILIDGRAIDAADCPAFDLAALKRDNPGLIHLETSWFGQEGPYANFEMTDSTVRALTGLIKLVGPAEGPPMHAPDFQTGILAGLWGFISVASSVLGRMPMATFRSAYNGAKHFLNALTANVRDELAATHPGIQVSLVSPGVVRTEFGVNAVYGGPDSRTLPNSQSADEVADVIAGVIGSRRADVYTRPGARQLVLDYLSALADDPGPDPNV